MKMCRVVLTSADQRKMKLVSKVETLKNNVSGAALLITVLLNK